MNRSGLLSGSVTVSWLTLGRTLGPLRGRLLAALLGVVVGGSVATAVTLAVAGPGKETVVVREVPVSTSRPAASTTSRLMRFTCSTTRSGDSSAFRLPGGQDMVCTEQP